MTAGTPPCPPSTPPPAAAVLSHIRVIAQVCRNAAACAH